MIGAAGVFVPAAIAWACVTLVQLSANPSSVQAGATVKLTGVDTAPGAPIEIHLDSPTGPLLATLPPHDQSVMTGSWTMDVTIPADTRPGEHFLVATQDYHNMNAGMPARATIYVNQPAPAKAAPPPRPTALEVGSGPSTASLLLLGAGVAAGALLLAGLMFLAAGRRPPQPEAQPARTS